VRGPKIIILYCTNKSSPNDHMALS